MKMFLSRLSANISRKRLEPCRLTAAQSGLLGCFNNNLTFPVKEQTFLLPSPENQQQKRFRWTKAKKKRQARFKRREVLERKGIPLSKPPYYTPRDTAVVNATSREKRLTEIQQHDEKVSSELQAQFQQEQEQETEKYFLRHHMTGLKMSDRVRKLFDLTNGSQKEVVQVQVNIFRIGMTKNVWNHHYLATSTHIRASYSTNL